MTIVKDKIIPTLIILLAGLIVSFAAVPLANTNFAEGFRGESTSERAETESADEGVALSGALVLLPLVKVAVIMGIGAGLTVLFALIIRKIRGAMSKPD